MVKTTVFKSNRSQAVRLPKAVALPEDVKHVDINNTSEFERVLGLRIEDWVRD